MSKGIEIDIDKIPFDDEKTYELFGRGDSVAVFQFESDGMRSYLKDLKPSRFEDLIAMVALYRPGPMAYLPNFIKRKHGKETIEYDLPEMEEYLQETYGITVYQEQVMLLSRKLAGFTRGQSDSLRKAMGKKKIEEMEKLKIKFAEGCAKNNISKDKVEKIWKDWEAFARYAFNKSHATCYAYVAYQTAYLKAHYPAEFIAANLGRNLHDIKKITHLMAEAKRMGISVLRPDINESAASFTVTGDNIVRFGLAAIKGVGDSAVENLVKERNENNHFTSIFNLAKRVNLKSLNKRSFEALAKAGAFDCFEGIHRSQYFNVQENENVMFIEKVVRHGATYQEQQNSMQASLFGDAESFEIRDPDIPVCEPWPLPQKLAHEKEVTGFYISGHPLDDYLPTMERFCSVTVDEVRNNLEKYKDQVVKFAGMITESTQKIAKNGSPFGIFTIEDFTGNTSLTMFSEDYLKRKHMLEPGNNVFVTARVEERHNRPGYIQMNITELYLLSETMEKLSKYIVLEIPADKMTEELSDELISLCRNNPGKTPMKIKISDEESNLTVTLKAGNVRVDPRLFIKSLDDRLDYKYFIH